MIDSEYLHYLMRYSEFQNYWYTTEILQVSFLSIFEKLTAGTLLFLRISIIKTETLEILRKNDKSLINILHTCAKRCSHSVNLEKPLPKKR